MLLIARTQARDLLPHGRRRAAAPDLLPRVHPRFSTTRGSCASTPRARRRPRLLLPCPSELLRRRRKVAVAGLCGRLPVETDATSPQSLLISAWISRSLPSRCHSRSASPSPSSPLHHARKIRIDALSSPAPSPTPPVPRNRPASELLGADGSEQDRATEGPGRHRLHSWLGPWWAGLRDDGGHGEVHGPSSESTSSSSMGGALGFGFSDGQSNHGMH